MISLFGRFRCDDRFFSFFFRFILTTFDDGCNLRLERIRFRSEDGLDVIPYFKHTGSTERFQQIFVDLLHIVNRDT